MPMGSACPEKLSALANRVITGLLASQYEVSGVRLLPRNVSGLNGLKRIADSSLWLCAIRSIR